MRSSADLFATSLITWICLLGLPAAHAADPLACENTLGIRLSEDAPDAVPLDDPDALWVHELIGRRVVDVDGTDRGECVSVIANPAADLLELDSGVLVPANFVTGVDAATSPVTVTIDPPEGLFELYEQG